MRVKIKLIVKKLYALSLTLFMSLDVPAQTAFLEVRNEPRHHLVFENEFVRILNVFVEPGDTTEYHRHNTPSVFIFFSTTKTGSQLYGSEPVTATFTAGTILFDSLNKERIHRVWNMDTNWLHVIDAEIKIKTARQKMPDLASKQLVSLFKERMINGYKLSLAAHEPFQFPVNRAGYLLVSLRDAQVGIDSGGTQENYFMKAGHYLWLRMEKKIAMHNQSDSSASFVLLEF